MDKIMFYFLLSMLAIVIVYVVLLYKNNKKIEIYKIVQGLVCEAEIRLGSGTGDLKYEFVVRKVHTLLPFYIKMFVSEKLLDIWIETAVDELQEMLDEEIKKEESRPKK